MASAWRTTSIFGPQGFRVWGLGFSGLGFRVYDLGFRSLSRTTYEAKKKLFSNPTTSVQNNGALFAGRISKTVDFATEGCARNSYPLDYQSIVRLLKYAHTYNPIDPSSVPPLERSFCRNCGRRWVTPMWLRSYRQIVNHPSQANHNQHHRCSDEIPKTGSRLTCQVC